MTFPTDVSPLSDEEMQAVIWAVAESCTPDLPMQHAKQRLTAALMYAANLRVTYGALLQVFAGKGVFTFTDTDSVAGIDLFPEEPALISSNQETP